MTEGLDAFRQAISNLERAAGGGSVPPPDDGMTAAEWFSAQPDEYRFSHTPPEADPGTAWAEDYSLIKNPDEYWDH